jgi:hypothetical protein
MASHRRRVQPWETSYEIPGARSDTGPHFPPNVFDFPLPIIIPPLLLTHLSPLTEVRDIVGPANQNGCIILCVGNFADEKF